MNKKIEIINEKIELFENIFTFLSSFEQISSSQYQKLLISSKNTLDQKNDIIQLHLIELYSSYGKYSDDFINYKWLTISSIFDTINYIKKIIHQKNQNNYDLSTMNTIVINLLQSGIDQISICSNNSVSHILNTFRILILYLYQNISLNNNENLSELSESSLFSSVSNIITELLESSWNVCFDTDDISYLNIKLFIHLYFSPELLSFINIELQQKYFERLMKISLQTKPFIIQFLIYRLTTICLHNDNYLLSIPFFRYFKDLLIYREPAHDGQCQSDEYLDVDNKDGAYTHSIYGIIEYGRVTGIDRFTSNQSTRILLLIFFEQQLQKQNNSIIWIESIQELILSLIQLNSLKSFKTQANTGSEKFGEKLRCWQALCILVKYIDSKLCLKIITPTLHCLADSIGHGIRVHIEIFCSALLDKFPDIVLPPLLELLHQYDHSQYVCFYSL